MCKKLKNVIIITADEMRGDAPGFTGNPDCKTPNLDDFAEKNIVFSNHFAAMGKCVPSRISMMTGRYPHTDGFRNIHEHLDSKKGNLLRTLKKKNYETAVFGLNHVWKDFFGNNKKSDGCVDFHSFTEGYFDSINEKECSVKQPDGNSCKPLNLPYGYEYGGRIEKPLSGHDDANRAEQAVHYLRNIRDKSRPFYMQLNFSAPHPPYKVEEPYFSMYNREKITPWPHELPENAPEHLRRMREIRTGLNEPEENFLELQAVYYAMITKVDSLIGKVLDTVNDEGLLENSIVVFAADHGDFAGQYGLSEKWDTAMNDCILKVPFILHDPDLNKAKKIKSLSEHTDFTPTILDLLDAEADWNMHGESLIPIIQNKKVKNAVFAEGGHEKTMIKRFNHYSATKTKPSGKQDIYQKYPETMSRTKAVRTDEWKLVIRLKGKNELYNIKKDPYELKNLYGQKKYNDILMKLMQLMIEWCIKTDTDKPHQEIVGA